MTSLYHCVRRSKALKVAFLSTAFLTLTATSALAAVSIDTITGWDGATFISSFGVPNSATFGQTITVAAGAAPLTSFSFEIGYCNANVAIRGSVYAWDGIKATGSSLFTSDVQTVTSGAAFNLVTFNTGSVSLPAGNYVLFASTSQDQAGAASSGCRWGTRGDTPYPGGQFVFMNNEAQPAQWTLYAWMSFPVDSAFRVDGLGTAPVPTSSEWALLTLAGLMGLFGLGAIRRRRSAVSP
jgi:hypothetical protein